MWESSEEVEEQTDRIIDQFSELTGRMGNTAELILKYVQIPQTCVKNSGFARLSLLSDTYQI